MGSLLRRLLEDVYLLGLYIYNHFYNFLIWLTEIWLFYRYPLLLKADFYWMLEYAFISPFRISRKSTQDLNLDLDLTVYGETPWPTLKRIAESVNLKSEDVFFDLGAGTGRNILFLYYFFGVSCRGFELIPRFVEKFAWLKFKLGLTDSVSLEAKNWFEADLTSGNVFLLVGTCYSDQQIYLAQQKLKEVPEGSWVITVSWPLLSSAFELVETLPLPFSWGQGTVYFQRKNKTLA